MYQAEKCPCSGRCQDWHVNGVAAVQGVHFTEAQAGAVAQLLNDMEEDNLWWRVPDGYICDDPEMEQDVPRSECERVAVVVVE